MTGRTHLLRLLEIRIGLLDLGDKALIAEFLVIRGRSVMATDIGTTYLKGRCDVFWRDCLLCAVIARLVRFC